MSQTARRVLSRRMAVTMAASVAAAALGVLFGSVVLSAVGLIVSLTVAFGARSPARLRYEVRHRLSTTSPTEGQDVDLEVEVRGGVRRRLVEWRLGLPAVASATRGATLGLDAVGRGGLRIDSAFQVPLFGLHRAGGLQVGVGDPFGFLQTTGRIGDPVDLRVYPRAVAWEAENVRSKQQRPLLGLFEVSQPGDGFEFFTLRDYHVGDRPRDVNWKASGRYGKMIVNQHQRENHAEVTILLDVGGRTRVGPRTESPFARGCRAAIEVARAHLQMRDRVRLFPYGAGVVQDPDHRESRKIRGIVEIIVGLEPRGATTLKEAVDELLPTLRRNAPVLLVSPMVGDPTVEDAAATLLAHGQRVFAFLPPAQLDPASGPAAAAWLAAQTREAARLRALGVQLIGQDTPWPTAKPVPVLEVTQ